MGFLTCFRDFKTSPAALPTLWSKRKYDCTIAPSWICPYTAMLKVLISESTCHYSPLYICSLLPHLMLSLMFNDPLAPVESLAKFSLTLSSLPSFFWPIHSSVTQIINHWNLAEFREPLFYLEEETKYSTIPVIWHCTNWNTLLTRISARAVGCRG